MQCYSERSRGKICGRSGSCSKTVFDCKIMDPKLQRCRIFIIEPDIIEQIISNDENIIDKDTEVITDVDKAEILHCL